MLLWLLLVNVNANITTCEIKESRTDRIRQEVAVTATGSGPLKRGEGVLKGTEGNEVTSCGTYSVYVFMNGPTNKNKDWLDV